MMLPTIFGENLFDDFMDDAFERNFFGGRNPLYGKHSKNLMKTDVKETETGYELDIDLPGFKKDEISAHLEDGYLTVSAAKGVDKDEKDNEGRYIRRERYSGSMTRSFYVGNAVTEEDIKAKYKTVTGYDLDQAKKLFEKAYKEALANGDILATDKIVLKYGTSADTEAVQRMFKFFDNAFKEAVKGTSLEGKLSLEFDASYSTKWADEFRAGSYEICAGGWTGAAWDPGYFLLAYLSPDYMYSKAWDTSTETMTFTMPGNKYYN